MLHVNIPCYFFSSLKPSCLCNILYMENQIKLPVTEYMLLTWKMMLICLLLISAYDMY